MKTQNLITYFSCAIAVLALPLASVASSAAVIVPPRQPDGNGRITVSGELKQWHKVTLTLDGPFAHERDGNGGIPAAGAEGNSKRQDNHPPNPFTDYGFTSFE